MRTSKELKALVNSDFIDDNYHALQLEILIDIRNTLIQMKLFGEKK